MKLILRFYMKWHALILAGAFLAAVLPTPRSVRAFRNQDVYFVTFFFSLSYNIYGGKLFLTMLFFIWLLFLFQSSCLRPWLNKVLKHMCNFRPGTIHKPRSCMQIYVPGARADQRNSCRVYRMDFGLEILLI